MTTHRLISLDVLRGATIAGMILVNNPGSWLFIYSPFEHAEWHGCTPTDLVFPFFLFAVGNAMSFVTNKWEKMEQSKVLWKIIRRTLIIFLLGYLMYWFPFIRLDENNNIRLFFVTHP